MRKSIKEFNLISNNVLEIKVYYFNFNALYIQYSIKIKEQTRKLAAGCSKHCFEVVDRTDEVSSKHSFEVVDETDEVGSKHGFEVVDETDEVSSKHSFEVVDETDEVSSKHCFEVVAETDKVSNHTYGKATLTWFEEIFEE
ncbi:chlorohydrolase [Streptococcus pneumoniae]|uniref:hypothetical protein n=1 Tax=Streptococcus pneumoniae TaxID=1313 RepID=UPI0005E31E25|nr:hypothetical protein [Streptococcus pneumoniae]CJR15670.1 chlorohydrolase [Streptococcus pneumoniae]